MRSIILIFFFLILIKSSLSYSQEKDSIPYDTNYIEDLSDKLAVRIYGINKFNQFSIKDNEYQHELDYSPNKNLNIGFGASYKWLGLAVAFNFPFINNDDEKYGHTNRFDIQTNIFTRKFLIDVFFQKYQGFYIENPESYLPDWTEEQNYPQRPDISSSTLGGSFTYVFKNKKYSAKAAYTQTDLQKKSAGSFLAGGFLSFFSLEGDSSLVPYELYPYYDEDLLFSGVQVSNYGLAFGYTHNFVLWKKFYLSFTLIPGVSVQAYDVNYENPDDDVHGSVLAGRFLVRTAFVYNSIKSFAGFTASNDNFAGNVTRNQSSNLNFSVGSIRFFYGRRFNIRKKATP